MTSSPRFWQKLGIKKQLRESLSSTSNSDSISLHSAISTYPNDDDPIYENRDNRKQSKHISTLSLKHKSSTISLYQQSTNKTEKNLRRASSVHPLGGVGQDAFFGEPMFKLADDYATQGDKTPLIKSPKPISAREKSQNEMTKVTSKLKKTKSNQSLVSVSTTASVNSGGGRSSIEYTQSKPNSKLRQPSIKSNASNNKKKFGHSSGDEDEGKPYITRSSSNGSSASTSDKKTRRSSVSRKKQTQNEDLAFHLLKDELEIEKSSARALKGQKEAIAKDLDYFCNMVDEITEEKELIKKKYEDEVNQNKILRKTINDLEARMASAANIKDTVPIVENFQQQLIQEQYIYHNNLQLKNIEISKLKSDLKQAQNQIQVLRKTMQQLLKAEGENTSTENMLQSETYDKDETTIIEDKESLNQASFHFDRHSGDNIAMLPAIDGKDQLSITPKMLNSSPKSKPYSVQYEFLKTVSVTDDDFHHNLTKRRSEDFSKSFARRRKDQLEEILGDVDSQLTKAKQKIRPLSS